MDVLGIDPSSTLSGAALVQRKRNKVTLSETAIWERDERRSHPWNLHDFFNQTKQWCSMYDPDMACVEALSVARGAQTTRMIAFYQAAAVLACKESGVYVVEARVKTARMIVLENGNLDKEQAHKLIKRMFPKHKFRRFPNGGGDETDATVLGVAGPDIAEL